MSGFGPLVSAAWLRENLAETDVRVIDLRYYLDGRSGRDAFAKGHVPGATFVDLDGEITGAQGAGRHPLPSGEGFQAAMRRAGVNRGDRVVVYDDQGGFSAGRLWFLLRYFGHDAVALLDGGLQAWGEPTEAGPITPAPGDFEAGQPHRGWIVARREVADRSARSVLLDARAAERFRGEVEPVYARAGHIPGAVNAVWKDNLNPDLTFRTGTELRRHYEGRGVVDGGDVIASCGSGVSACVDLVGLELAGLTGARLYEGSFSEWSAASDTEVATGPS